PSGAPARPRFFVLAMRLSRRLRAAPHEMDQLEPVALAHLDVVVARPGEDLAVALHHDEPRLQPERLEQGAHARARGDLPLLAVDLDANGLHQSRSRYPPTAAPGSVARH